MIINEITLKDSYDNLQAAFGEPAPAFATVIYWFREFNRENLDDDPRSGRPPTAVTHRNVIRVELLLRENGHIIHRDIQAELTIGSHGASTIPHEHLKVASSCFAMNTSFSHQRTIMASC